MKKLNLFIAIGFCLVSNIAFGKVILPEIFGDNIVLQQKSLVMLWGWAEPNEKVTVYTSWNHGTARVRADSQGIWRVRSKTIKAGGPYYIEFKASNHIRLENVLLGEVWLVSGQSNMGSATGPAVLGLGAALGSGVLAPGGLGSATSASAAMGPAAFGEIRMIDVRHTIADTPVMGVSGKWKICSSTSSLNTTGKLTPVGIINSSWGGTPIESWINRPVLESDVRFKPILETYEKHLAEYPGKHEAYLIKMDSWHKDTSANKGRAPAAPVGPKSSVSPGKLYNGMIAPLLNCKIAGVIWYQGRANVKEPSLYQELFPVLMRSWRSSFKNDMLPFHVVQIKP
ncbi:MAG TPA: sialate O-acetylesterase [Puia sp.]|jgi:sialate O-acetylesterase